MRMVIFMRWPWFPANAWGLHDMHGNVSEWCMDSINYLGSPDSTESLERDLRVHRGGGWLSDEWGIRSAHRAGAPPSVHFDNGGFRVAQSPIAK